MAPNSHAERRFARWFSSAQVSRSPQISLCPLTTTSRGRVKKATADIRRMTGKEQTRAHIPTEWRDTADRGDPRGGTHGVNMRASSRCDAQLQALRIRRRGGGAERRSRPPSEGPFFPPPTRPILGRCEGQFPVGNVTEVTRVARLATGRCVMWSQKGGTLTPGEMAPPAVIDATTRVP